MQRVPTRPMKATTINRKSIAPVVAPVPVVPFRSASPMVPVVTKQEHMDLKESLKYSSESDSEAEMYPEPNDMDEPNHEAGDNHGHAHDHDMDIDMDDLYGDLDLEASVFQRSDVQSTHLKTKAELETKIQELEELIVKLLKDNDVLKTVHKKIKSENENLKQNMKDLLETSQSDISKKNFMLTNLQKKFTEIISKTRTSSLLSKQDVEDSAKLIQESITEASSKPEITLEMLKDSINKSKCKIQITDQEKKAGTWTRTFKFGNCSFYNFSTEQIPFGKVEEVVLSSPVAKSNPDIRNNKPMISKTKPESDLKTEQQGQSSKNYEPKKFDRDDHSRIPRKSESKSTSREPGERCRSRSNPRTSRSGNNSHDVGSGRGHRTGRSNGHHSSQVSRNSKYNPSSREREEELKQRDRSSNSRDRRSEDLRNESDKRKFNERDKRSRNENQPVRTSPRKHSRPSVGSSRR